MKRLRKDERKASSGQYAAKMFMMLNAYLHIAISLTGYEIWHSANSTLQIFNFRHFNLL